MSDRLERDVEEVLSNIEDFDWRRRQQRQPGPLRRALQRFGNAMLNRAAALTAGHLMLIGALLLIVGLVLRLRGVGIWMVIAGVIVLLIGLFWTSRGGGRVAGQPRGGYWRDRYISYDTPRQSGVLRIRDWFRRR